MSMPWFDFENFVLKRLAKLDLCKGAPSIPVAMNGELSGINSAEEREG